MPRIRLQALERYSFRIEIPVRVTDVNYGGHLGWDRLLTLVHEARIAFLAHHGFTEMNCGGVSLILVDAAVNYRAEAFGGDVLCFEVSAGAPSHSGFRLFHRVKRRDELIALVETGMACFSYETRRAQPLPKALDRLWKAP